MKKYDYVKTFTFDGKRYKVRGNSEKDAIVKMANKIRDLEEGKVVISNSMTVREWAVKAVETYKTNQNDITREKYMQSMRHCIFEPIGSMQLKKVKPLHCQQVVNMQTGKSKRQIDGVCQMLNFIFRKAVENKLLLENPAENITKPAGYTNGRRAITEQERKHLLKVAEADDGFVLFLLMLYCGCRPSEAMEAMGKDISLLEGQPVLHIRGTKTRNADRTVPIPDALYCRIKDTPKFGYIAPNQAGKKHKEGSYKRTVKRLYREMNISMGCRVYRNKLIPPFPLAEDFVPYDLRHTYCTDLQKKGVDIRSAQYLMGHSDISLTANIYTHADNTTILEAAKLINLTEGVPPGVPPQTTSNDLSVI